MKKRRGRGVDARSAGGELVEPRAEARASAIAVVALAAAAVWAYSNSFAGVLVYDDGLSIVENTHIRSLWPLSAALTAPAEATVSGRPVASLSLAINYALAPADARDVFAPAGPLSAPGTPDRFLRNVRGYHAANLAIHVAAALALFGAVRRTLLTRRMERLRDRATPLAFLVALLWVVHPLNTQAVTYVVQRVESLMGLFYLLTLYCAIRSASAGRSAVWGVAAVVFCALGMGTKEVMVTAPLVVVLWDWTFGVDWRTRVRLYAGLAATWAILILLVVSERRSGSVGFGLGWTWWSYLQTQAGVIVHYLRLAFVPSPLVFDYGWPPARSIGDFLPHAVLLTLMFAGTVWAIVRRRPIGFLGGAFLLILAPTSSVLPIATEVAAEHRMYLPLAAIIAAVVVAAGALPRKWATPAVAVAAVVVLAFGSLTQARNRDYWSDEALWIDTIQKRPSNARAYVGYGIDLLAAGRYAEAERQLRTAVSLEDSNGRAHMNLGSALCAQGKLAEGVPHLERALALNPNLDEAYGLLGEAFAGMGDYARAAGYLRKGVDRLPANAFLANRTAWLLATSPNGSIRDGAKAAELAERAVRSGGENAIFLDTLAAAYAEQNRFADAATTARRAVSLARAQGQAGFVRELEQHAALYENGRKLRTR